MFTRVSDDETLIPVMVFGPYEQSRTVGNIVRPIMQSAEVRVSYLPTVYPSGEYQLLFETYSEAALAAEYFSDTSLYLFDGPTTTEATLVQIGGYIVEIEAGSPDTSFAMQFAVNGNMTITQNGLWELRVPYQEVPE